MKLLKVEELLKIYSSVMELTGGSAGLRDRGALESALAQPRMSFAGVDLYPTLVEKASALGFSIIKNHPFVDGNKRIGYMAMEVFLIRNGFEISGTVNDREGIILHLAASEITRDEFTDWLKLHVMARTW